MLAPCDKFLLEQEPGKPLPPRWAGFLPLADENHTPGPARLCPSYQEAQSYASRVFSCNILRLWCTYSPPVSCSPPLGFGGDGFFISLHLCFYFRPHRLLFGSRNKPRSNLRSDLGALQATGENGQAQAHWGPPGWRAKVQAQRTVTLKQAGHWKGQLPGLPTEKEAWNDTSILERVKEK